MATIKAIEGRSVHQIQSGQVIVDLCSVVKELVENSLDASATSIDVRFKNNGLDAIEVQDNGEGISYEDYETIALKHYTSKLSTYVDLTSLQTFGFRGEALSSLCALSKLHISTARADEVPKGTRLDFETSGKLKGTQVVASQKGTTVGVEGLFQNLPVRRKELEKNIKREYGKVLGILNAYACISAGVKFNVTNQMAKGRKSVVFSTNSNPTTRENIANVFGAKTLSALVPLDLNLEMQSTSGTSQRWSTQEDEGAKDIHILGHISRPVFGEGRQTPDRQMFFVNSRPCGLPQVAKAFNEVYKSYNTSQSPFIFADFKMDTHAYDVNVSPDKRTILLHDQTTLLESLKTSLTELFESQDQTVPYSQIPAMKLPTFKQLTLNREASTASKSATSDAHTPADKGSENDETEDENGKDPDPSSGIDSAVEPRSLIQSFLGQKVTNRGEEPLHKDQAIQQSKEKRKFAKKFEKQKGLTDLVDEYDDSRNLVEGVALVTKLVNPAVPVQDFNRRMAEQEAQRVGLASRMPSPSPSVGQDLIPSISTTPSHQDSGAVQKAFNSMRPKRSQPDIATITIGDETTTSPIGTPLLKRQKTEDLSSQRSEIGSISRHASGLLSQKFGRSLRAFTAPGMEAEQETVNDIEDSSEDGSNDTLPRNDTSSDEEEASHHSSHGLESETSEEKEADDASLPCQDDDGSDEEYIDETEKRAREEAKVEQLIRDAEEEAVRPSKVSVKRANTILKGGAGAKDSTTQLVQTINTSVAKLEQQISELTKAMERHRKTTATDVDEIDTSLQERSAEEQLSLTVSKGDFERMRIVGQFNLGFILAIRASSSSGASSASENIPNKEELFIIDQHASDEKYNFERLQAETVVQNQRLVRPRTLDLTAIEEEIIVENLDALEKNGFIVEIDNSGEEPVGRRCKLISLPMSREVVFDTRDLEEIISLLAESPLSSLSSSSSIPRPAKVRRMFAMRACRSSIMIGRTLTAKQMEKVVRHMGEIEKPWNCPHGRPTMRHVMGLSAWENWGEGDGLAGAGGGGAGKTDWRNYMSNVGGGGRMSSEEIEAD
ncbi:MAG: hypothetical protein M1827_001779 [Pycnora praestabilis]|nr:MAG: hypothetical protein M1827_001779 [Pycnora praestabilis]